MKIIRKITIILGLSLALVLGAAAASYLQNTSNTAYAADDWCSGWSKGIIKCPTGDLSFKQYSGKLVSLTPEGYDTALTKSTSIRDFVQKVVNYALSFLGFIAVLLMIYAGFTYLTAGGVSEKTDKAKKTMGYTVIGLLLILGSYAIVNTILSGPFGGGGAIEGEIQGWEANGYNAPTGEILDSAQRLVNGYQYLYQSVEDIKTVSSEVAKVNVNKSKGTMLQFLNSAGGQLKDVKLRSNSLSSVSSKTNDLLRYLDKQTEAIQNTPDATTEILDTAWTEITQTLKGGADQKYPAPSVFAILTDMKNDFGGDSAKYSTKKLEDVKCDPLDANYPRGTLGEHVCVLQKTYKDIATLSIYENTNIPTLYSSLGEKFFDLADAVNKIDQQTLDLSTANQALVSIIQTEDELIKSLKSIKFVQTKLVADMVEGGAPLIVHFNVLNSSDPSGKSIDSKNIKWDMFGSGDGDKTNSECYTRAKAGGVSGGSNKEEGFTNYCIYKNPGVYRATVKILSSDPSKYAAGVSSLDIKILPPKVSVNVKVTNSKGEATQMYEYSKDGFLQVASDYLSLTKEEAKKVTFTAEDPGVNGQTLRPDGYKWDFGDGSKPETSAVVNNHQYESEGAYTVTLEVTSERGDTARKIFTVVVGSPAARIDYSPKGQTFVGQTLSFDGSRSYSDAGKIVKYEWSITKDIGTLPGTAASASSDSDNSSDNPTTGNEKMFSYTFKKSGKYTVNLKVTDNLGKDDTKPVEINVISELPVAKFTYSIPNPNQPSKVYFDASDSYNPDGPFEDLRFEWTIGDGSYPPDKIAFQDGTSSTDLKPRIWFAEPGSYDITLKVHKEGEAENRSTTIKQTIKIENTLDIAWAENQTSVGQLGKPAKGEAEVSFNFKSKTAVAYEISFSDGEKATGDMKKVPVSHTYTIAGKYDVKVVVYDKDDNSNEIKKKIFIGGGDKPVSKITVYVNNDEIADLDKGLEISRADQVTFDASNSKNTDGTGKNLKYNWDFGDKVKSTKKTIYHNYTELSPKNQGYYPVKLKVCDTDKEDLCDESSLKVNVISVSPHFSSLQVLPRPGSKMTTPVYMNAFLYGAVDKDGKVTQYKWWYYNVKKPDDTLGMQLTEMPSATLVIGTNGAEGEEKSYGFGVEITDNDNNKYSTTNIDGYKSQTVTVKNGPNALPIPKFSVDRTKVFAGEPVNFSSSSTDSDGKIVQYIWDFEGDGFFNNDPTALSSIQHIYNKKNLNGFLVRLKVVDNEGGEGVSEALTIYVDSNAALPTAAFTTQIIDGKTVQFTNNSTADDKAGAAIESYKWDVDTASQFKTADPDGNGKKDDDTDSILKNPTFIYDEFGIYQVKLTVVDSQGNENSVTNTVNVSPATGIGGGTGTGTGTDTGTGSGTNPCIGPFGTTKPGCTQGSGTSGGSGTPGGSGLGAEPTGPALKAILITKPVSDTDGIIRLPGTSGEVAFDFSQSTGNISNYIFDKNILFDTNKDGNPANEEDFKTSLPGVWTTNFDKSWGKIVVRLTVVDIYGNTNVTLQEISFK